jgi:hypothetical protein
VRWSSQFDEVILTSGNRNDVTKLLPLLDAVPAIRGRVDRCGAAVTRRNGGLALVVAGGRSRVGTTRRRGRKLVVLR